MQISNILSFLTAKAAVTYDQFTDTTGLPDAPASSVEELVGILDSILTITYWLALTLAILFIIFAAFTYLTAAGDVEKVKKAHHQIIYAAIAIAVTLIAIGAVQIIETFLMTGG
ncbi:MAG: hypothetical protein V3T98_01085 [Candidatus Paceibacterota bacterium]